MTTELETIRTGFDPFLAMDKLDDEAILAEIKGRIIEKWVYHYPQDGKEVWGLSKVGVDQACTEMAKRGEVIRELSLTFQPDPTDNRYMLFVAVAARYAVDKDGKQIFLDQVTGTKRQCVYYVKKSGITEDLNNFYFEQGAMKAFRNARSRLISEETRARIIGLAKEQGKVQEVKGEEIAEPANSQQPQKPVDAQKVSNKINAAWANQVITEPQAKRLYAIAKAAGWTAKDIEIFLQKRVGNPDVEAVKVGDYQKLCSDIEKGLTE